MRIRIDHPAAVRLELEPGDELVVQKSSPALENLLRSARADGVKFAHVLKDGDEDDTETTTVAARGETATMGRGRRDQRTASVS